MALHTIDFLNLLHNLIGCALVAVSKWVPFLSEILPFPNWCRAWPPVTDGDMSSCCSSVLLKEFETATKERSDRLQELGDHNRNVERRLTWVPEWYKKADRFTQQYGHA